ncbi:zinc-alpha-2-glycoprotein-like isoform X2 [Macrotis lagotis]|uniref:zinc-alpha-2-glycoprotein-like isoform X2 n=1 Tax=Macrotis lagotis TaxID=92651 RepID=UPI003D698C12
MGILTTVFILLFLTGITMPKESRSRCSSLTYEDMALSNPGPEQFNFTNIGYLNVQSFYQYDSKSQRAVPLPPWDQVEGLNDWQKETQFQKRREDFVLENMQSIIDYYNDGNGSHIFKGRFGCKFCDDNFIKGFWKYQFDGQDFIEFNTTEIPAWIPLDPAADMIKQRWEADPGAVYRAKAYLEEECIGTLRRYLELGKAHLQKLIPPKVNLIYYPASRRNKILECKASDYYPDNVNLHWIHDGKLLKNEVGNKQSREDGTYESSITISVPFEKKFEYSCLVDHEALPESLIVAWDKN